jgi:hypothetical protein
MRKFGLTLLHVLQRQHLAKYHKRTRKNINFRLRITSILFNDALNCYVYLARVIDE